MEHANPFSANSGNFDWLFFAFLILALLAIHRLMVAFNTLSNPSAENHIMGESQLAVGMVLFGAAVLIGLGFLLSTNP